MSEARKAVTNLFCSLHHLILREKVQIGGQEDVVVLCTDCRKPVTGAAYKLMLNMQLPPSCILRREITLARGPQLALLDLQRRAGKCGWEEISLLRMQGTGKAFRLQMLRLWMQLSPWQIMQWGIPPNTTTSYAPKPYPLSLFKVGSLWLLR